jgi:hypothetical protein
MVVSDRSQSPAHLSPRTVEPFNVGVEISDREPGWPKVAKARDGVRRGSNLRGILDEGGEFLGQVATEQLLDQVEGIEKQTVADDMAGV